LANQGNFLHVTLKKSKQHSNQLFFSCTGCRPKNVTAPKRKGDSPANNWKRQSLTSSGMSIFQNSKFSFRVLYAMLFFKQVSKRVGSAKAQTIFNVSVLTDRNVTFVSNLATSLTLAQNTLPGS
jgi:hypothetical protein